MYMYYLLGYKLVGSQDFSGTLSSRSSNYTVDTNKTKGEILFYFLLNHILGWIVLPTFLHSNFYLLLNFICEKHKT